MKQLDQLPQIAERALGGLQADSELKNSIQTRYLEKQKRHHQKSENYVVECARDDHDHALPYRLIDKCALVVAFFVFTLESAVASYREQTNGILRFALLESEKPGTHAERELVYLYSEFFCRYKMAELMNKNDQLKEQDTYCNKRGSS